MQVPESVYDDDIAHRYHFPRRYLDIVSECVGDWIIYRQPRAGGGSKAYFATAMVTGLESDPLKEGSNYAVIEKFLPFDRVTPWRAGGRYAEAALRNIGNVSRVGLYLRGRSVRAVDRTDFAEIVLAGLGDTLDPKNAYQLNLEPNEIDKETLALLTLSRETSERGVEQILLNRKIRDANFRLAVCNAYGNRCAVTGLQIVNGGGRSEVQAAHIWPVSDGGPDTVQNGIALSATAHWLFDRHLISLTDQLGLLVSHNKVPSEYRILMDKHTTRIHLPNDRRSWPSPRYVTRHREIFASG